MTNEKSAGNNSENQVSVNKQVKNPKKRLKIIGIIAGASVLCFIVAVIFGAILNSTPGGKKTSTANAISELTAESQKTDVAAITQTVEAKPTQTKTATEIPTPTLTPKPTRTFTPKPTATPLPEPILLTGSGDDIVDFENPFEFAIVKITGNASSRHFAIINYGSDGTKYDLLVNTTDSYEGIRPLDFYQDQHTTRFEVTATGEWSIEILPIIEARDLTVPGTVDGSGDDVIRLSGKDPDIANITGNAGSRHFAVIGYANFRDLLVNTTDPYDGRIVIDSDTFILEIIASGEWSITIED